MNEENIFFFLRWRITFKISLERIKAIGALWIFGREYLGS